MKYLLVLTVGICLLISVPVMADQAEDEAAVRETVKQVYATANKHDVEAYLATATEDVENWVGSLKGKAAFEKYFTETWERQKDMHAKFLDEIGIIFVTPEVAIYKCRDEITGSLDADGNVTDPATLAELAGFLARYADHCRG